jgi:hypothetical protein
VSEHDSKQILLRTDPTRARLQDLLDGDETHGFDVDCLYSTTEGYTLVEFWKAEKIPAYNSNPKFYPPNWKKFYSLAWVATLLRVSFYIVNYDEDRDTAGLLRVKRVRNGSNITQLKDYIETERVVVDGKVVREFSRLQKWFRDLNAHAVSAWKVTKIRDLRKLVA